VDDSDALHLLSDVRRVFIKNNLTRISTSELVFRLQRIDESPWDELTQYKLARMLKPFGISSRQVWTEKRNVRGYEHDDFKSVFDSYLSPASR
jgi:hypothetical protein